MESVFSPPEQWTMFQKEGLHESGLWVRQNHSQPWRAQSENMQWTPVVATLWGFTLWPNLSLLTLFGFCITIRSSMIIHHKPVPVCAQSLGCVQLFSTPWTRAGQAPHSMGFSRQEHWSGLPFSPPGDRPHPEMESTSPALAGRFFNTEPPGKPLYNKEHSNCAVKDQDFQCKRETNIKLLSSH